MNRTLISAAGKFILPTLIRGAAVILSLGAVLLSYRILSARDFTSLNLILFCMALGSAFASPINRRFWLKDPEAAYAPSAAATLVLLWGAVLLGYLLPQVVIEGDVSALLLAAPVLMYIYSKTLERFMYGRILAQGNVTKALLVTLVFSTSEIVALLVMGVFPLSDVGSRLLIPSMIFLFSIMLLMRFNDAVAPLVRLRSPSCVFLDIYTVTLRAPGPGVLLLTAIMTSAAMIDRVLLAYFNIFNLPLTADYLLSLSYAIALQTVLSILFDMARRYIFFQGVWQDRALLYAAAIIGCMIAACILAIALFPLLRDFAILPSSIPWTTWAAMVLRSVVLLAGYICFVDLFQKGRIKAALGVASFVLLAVGIFFVAIGAGASLSVASQVLSVAFLVTLIILSIRLPWVLQRDVVHRSKARG